MLKQLAMIATLLWTPISSFANIFEIDTVDGLTSYLENVDDPSTLVMFDIDMVLLIPYESYFRMPTLKKYRSIYKEMTESLTGPEKDMLVMYMLMDGPLVPLDDKMNALVQSLQQRQLPTIAFSASLTGALDRLANSAAWRLFTLEFAGYHFETSFPPLTHSVVFEKLPKYLGAYPVFNRGVLMTNGVLHGEASKEKVLIQFLKYVYESHNRGHRLPKHIIMIDDRKENLEDIETSLHQSFPEIEFTGIQLTAADHVPVTAITEAEFKSKMKELIKQVKLNKELLSKP